MKHDNEIQAPEPDVEEMSRAAAFVADRILAGERHPYVRWSARGKAQLQFPEWVDQRTRRHLFAYMGIHLGRHGWTSRRGWWWVPPAENRKK